MQKEIKNKMVDETVETKEVSNTRSYAFPKDGLVIEAESMEDALEQRNLLLSNDKK